MAHRSLALPKLEAAMMIVADKQVSLVLTGTGDVLELEANIAVASGPRRSPAALAAARALADGPLSAEEIVREVVLISRLIFAVDTSTATSPSER